MTLRAQIETAIRASANSHQAAIAVCRVLDVEIGLAGNGWFDDDDEMRALLATAAGSTNPDHWNASAQILEAALAARLRAASKSVAPENLGEELAGCTEAELAAMLNIEVPESELAVLRLIVLTRINSRGHT